MTSRSDPWHSLPMRVKRLTIEAPDVITVELAFPNSYSCDAFHFSPGQFNMLYVPGVGEAAISIAGQAATGGLLHTIRSVGSVTKAIANGGVGMTVGLRGPFGTCWPVASPSSTFPGDFVVAAGGIGIAPLRALIENMVHRRSEFGTVSVLLGARTAADLLYQADLEQWRQADIEVQRTVDRPDGNWSEQVGVVTLLLDRLSIPHPTTTQLMTCGPEVMMRYVAQSAISRGIPPANIWVTLERNMNCAIGLCGHCQLGPEFLCKDGPVFRYDRVSAWLSTQGL